MLEKSLSHVLFVELRNRTQLKRAGEEFKEALMKIRALSFFLPCPFSIIKVTDAIISDA